MAGEVDSLGCDVLVVGAGLAGTAAALAAARDGARVALACSGPVFSGSSFFPGTWGLGLVGPDGPGDGADLLASVLEVGRGVAIERLSRTLVDGIDGAVAWLDALGVGLRRAEAPDERDFIPCFDHKRRSWHGLGRGPFREAMGPALYGAAVSELPFHDLVDLVGGPGGVRGALLANRKSARLLRVDAGAIILATGGFGGLYGRTLTMPDVSGTAAAVALAHGARLVNIEFIQIMPGLVSPVGGVVFNERTFRFARLEGFSAPHERSLLESRAGHGPFTASLPDHVVDLALAQAGPRGAAVSYALPARMPEFMRTYFDWFEGAFGTSPSRDVRILPYAHASNGGILIGPDASTGVPGLFACGEATGGMHGADRIGGLSSANALVFGRIAGQSAAAWAGRGHRAGACGEATLPALATAPCAREVMRDLRRLMDGRCLILRSEEGLGSARERLGGLAERLARESRPTKDVLAASATTRARQAALSASALVCAMLERRESRGAHFRCDYPQPDPAQARPLVIALEDGVPVARRRGTPRG